MKDECAGRPIAEFIGLCPKMYTILAAGGGNIKKAKGVKKNVVKKHIRHEQYKEALFRKRTFRYSMDVLRSERHRIYGQRLNKVSLSPFDSKSWIAENRVDTLAQTPFRLALLRWMRTLTNCSALENPIRRKLSVGRHYEEFLPDKTTRRAVLQVIQQGLVGLGHRASQPAHLKRPYRVSRAAPTALQLAGLVQIANTNTWREPLLLETNRAVGNYRGGLLRHGLGLDGIRRLFASQSSHFAVQSGYNAGQQSHPLCLPLTRREAHFLGVLVPKQPLCEGPVPALHDALVLWISTRPRRTRTECFASSWLTAPMNSRPGSTWRSFGHFNGPRL